MKTNNRLPLYILGVLVLVALVWRVSHPPKPPVPGPLGKIPHWDSMTKVGEMGPWAVNPSGTMWAGAWNQRGKDGKTRAAVWIIDLTAKQASHCEMNDGSPVSALSWADDRTVRALQPGAEKPITVLRAADATVQSSMSLPSRIEDAPLWPSASDAFITETTEKTQARFALASASGKETGQPVSVSLDSDSAPGHRGAIDARSGLFVFSVAAGETGGKDSYYLADSKTGTSKPIFRSEDLPGRVEGLWVSPAGVLVVISERDKFHRMVYGPAGKLEEVKPKTNLDLAGNWPDAPKSMMFVSYNGGYDLDLRTGKVKQVFDLTKLGTRDGYWREQIQDGRLYPRKDGGYTSVSMLANAIDIRIIAKDGSKAEPLLPRR